MTVSNQGNDSVQCGTAMSPCKSLRKALEVVQENGTIYLKVDTPYEKFSICQGGSESLFINKSVNIQALTEAPTIECFNSSSYGIFINGNTFEDGGMVGKKNSSADSSIVSKTKFVSVRFHNIIFTNFKIHHRKCSLNYHGIISVVNASLTISNCKFINVCTAIRLTLNSSHVNSISIDNSDFEHVHYLMYSKETTNAKINVSSTDVSGMLQDSGGPSYAITLTSNGDLSLFVSKSMFLRTNEGISLTLNRGMHHVFIKDSLFGENNGQSLVTNFGRYFDAYQSIFSLKEVTFVNNNGYYASTIHLVATSKVKPYPKVTIEGGLFQNTDAAVFFGALYADGVEVNVIDSYFQDNVAGEKQGAIQGFGGAIYVETGSKVSVINSLFKNNSCSGFGGTIYSRGSFTCINCTFYGPEESVKVKPLLGDILYATAGLVLINTTWYVTTISSDSKAIIWHPGSPTLEDWGISVSGYFEATCPVGHNITYFGVQRSSTELTQRLSMACKACQRTKYSLQNGYVNIKQRLGSTLQYTKTSVHCYNCKYGAVCKLGKIRSKSNYHGYHIDDEKEQVQFVSCPVGYCCTGRECTSYRSCRKNREGLLCGKCKPGMTENLVNSECVAKSECNDKWFWMVFLPFGIVYVLFFIYLDKVSNFLKKQLLWWEQSLHIANGDLNMDVLDASDIQGSSKTAHNQSTTNEQKAKEQTPVNDERQKDIDSVEKVPIRQPDLFTDALNVTFYFYQMLLLIRMHDNVVLDRLLSFSKGLYSSIFTLSYQGTSSFTVCPFSGLTAVSKMVFVRSFAVYVLVILFVMHISVDLINWTLKRNTTSSSFYCFIIDFDIRLKVATIQILMIAYATLTTTLLTLVNCIPVRNHAVLLVDGTIRCYQWWQYTAFLFIFGWVIPFPVILVVSIVSLKKKKISYREFAFSWSLPLIYLTYFILKKMSQCPNCVSVTERSREEQKSIDQIIQRLECSFYGPQETLLTNEMELTPMPKTVVDSSTNNASGNLNYKKPHRNDSITYPQPVFWQGAMIGRRLILILIFTFINNPVSRLYAALLACILFMVHHLYYRPYVINAMNFIETVSSTALIAFCSMNLFFAYSYVSDLPIEDTDQTMSAVFYWIEAVFLAVLPSLFLLGILLFMLARITVAIATACSSAFMAGVQNVSRLV